MSADEALADQPRKFQSRAAARAAFDRDVRLDRSAHEGVVLQWWRDLVLLCRDLPDPLREIADLHTPSLPRPDSSEQSISAYCPSCSGCCDSEDAPCDTLTAIVRHHFPDHGSKEVGGFRPTRRFEEYWVEPMVTVTFAHFTEFMVPGHGVKTVGPMAQHTMPLAKAEEFYSRLLTTSMDRVDRLSGVKRRW